MDTTTGPARRHRRSAGAGRLTVLLVAGTMLAGCASFPDSSPTVTVQPSLSPVMPSVISPSEPGASPSEPSASPSSSARATSSPTGHTPSSPTSGSTATTPADPCAPIDPAVVATCLDAPWGLAPLPDGTSALVGERTTGKVFRVARQTTKTLVATIGGIDAAGDGGLLGIALSPYYTEDGLIYAYVTTATDNRIVRFAPGQKPKPILTGIPKGSSHNGGPIAFGSDDLLYVATGDAGDAAAAAAKDSLAGKVLRVDTFGKPAKGNPGGSAVYASGLTDPTGICAVPGGAIAVLDHRPAADLLLPVAAGRDYRTPAPGDALWTYQPGDGGGVDCAVSAGYLLASSLTAAKITAVELLPSGGFTGSPQDLVEGRYGRLLSLTTGAQDVVWATTSNKDGHGKPIPSDDRVIVLPAAAGGGGGGGPD
jgi:hypothetical protein